MILYAECFDGYELNTNEALNKGIGIVLPTTAASEKLKIYSWQEFRCKASPGQFCAVEGMLGSGVYILAGPPKSGKSYLALHVAYEVSVGRPLFGHKTNKCPVLFAALEDSGTRLLERVHRMGDDAATTGLSLVVGPAVLTVAQLEDYCADHPDTGLIIIDSYQSMCTLSDEGQVMADLNAFAKKHSLCVLLTYHTRKRKEPDALAALYGKNGPLTGADGALILRTEKMRDGSAVLEVLTRDFPRQRIPLERNPQRLTWELGSKEVTPTEQLLEAVASLVTAKHSVWQGSAAEMAAALSLDMPSNVLSRRLNENKADLLYDFGVRYEHRRGNTGSHITLTREQAKNEARK